MGAGADPRAGFYQDQYSLILVNNEFVFFEFVEKVNF